MKRLLHILLFAAALLLTERAAAQYYTWGSDPTGLKWSQVRTPDVRIIYPDTAAAIATRTLFCVERIKPYIGYGFRHSAMRIPFVMHPENFQSNGLVMWLPKRVEFLTSPAVESYSMPWYKQLTAHEYRHAVQYNNLNRGVIKALSYVLGQQGSTIGLLYLPIWLIEGDAVLSETEMSSFGRGLQPSFTLEYRALGREMLRRRNPDKWFCGSYREYIPDHYQLGYQIARYSYDRYGENIWDKVAWYSIRNPYIFFTTPKALKKFYGTSVHKLFDQTFLRLNDYWEQLPDTTPSTEPIAELEPRNHTVYRWPVARTDTTLLIMKSDLNRSERIVEMNLQTGREREIARTGQLSTRPDVGNGRVWWTEYRRSKLFEQRVASQLCYLDLDEGRPRTLRGVKNALYPTVTDQEGIAWVEYTPDGRYTLVHERRRWPARRLEVPRFTEVHGLAWDDRTRRFYLLTTDDEGMRISTFDDEGRFLPVTRSAYVTLSDLRARDGRLYFGSIQSGRDEAHCYDLREGREYRLTESRYGAFDPAPVDKRTIAVTDYTARGYRPALQRLDTLRPVEYARLPRNTVNPPSQRWEVINLDTVRFTERDSVDSYERHRRRHYPKGLSLIKIHSWMPLSVDPFSLVDEHNVAVNLGATLLSQNLLSNTEAFFSWGWSHDEQSIYRLGFRYFGLGVHLSLEGTYGGQQTLYALAQKNSLTGELEYQNIPRLDTYYSFGASATLPLYYQRGYRTRQLSLSASWNFSNGLVAKVGQIRLDEELHTITNLKYIGYDEGLHKISFGVGFSDAVRMAAREFAPRWGYSLYADYAFNPAIESFSDLISLYGKAWLPGIVRPHSLMIALAYQTSIGGFETPSGTAMLTYKSTRLLPRGFTSQDIRSDDYTAFSVDYQLPIWYPEGGIPSVLYFKRIRLNIGFDQARFHVDRTWERLYSCGVDLLLDVNVFRQPASATSTVKLSFYRPSKGGFWMSAGVGLPF